MCTRPLLLAAFLILAAPAAMADGVLEEVVLGKVVANGQTLTVNVGSHGCTSKRNFRMDVRTEPGIGISTNHVLTLMQVSRDECKALFDEGVDLVYDLRAELGIPPHQTYSLTNKIDADHE